MTIGHTGYLLTSRTNIRLFIIGKHKNERCEVCRYHSRTKEGGYALIAYSLPPVYREEEEEGRRMRRRRRRRRRSRRRWRGKSAINMSRIERNWHKGWKRKKDLKDLLQMHWTSVRVLSWQLSQGNKYDKENINIFIQFDNLFSKKRRKEKRNGHNKSQSTLHTSWWQ